MDKILVCVDLSPLSRRVLEKAIELGKKIKAQVILAHVRDKSPTKSHATPNHSDLSARELIRDNNEMDKLEELLRDSGLEFQLKQPQGQVDKEVLNLLKEEKPLFLVMGSEHNSALHHVVSGSVAARVLEKNSTPLLLVP